MAKTYDLKLVVCTIGGVLISGYGESDALAFEWDEDIATPTVMADGTVVYSRTNNRAQTLTITLSQHSLAYQLLASIVMLAQHGEGGPAGVGIAPPVILPTPLAMVDPSNGDSVFSFDCVMLSRPSPSKGKTAGEVQFKFHLPSPQWVYGPANVL